MQKPTKLAVVDAIVYINSEKRETHMYTSTESENIGWKLLSRAQIAQPYTPCNAMHVDSDSAAQNWHSWCVQRGYSHLLASAHPLHPCTLIASLTAAAARGVSFSLIDFCVRLYRLYSDYYSTSQLSPRACSLLTLPLTVYHL